MNTSKLIHVRMTKLVVMALALAAAVMLPSSYACADPGDTNSTSDVTLQSDEVSYIPDDDFPDSEELFAGYVERQFYGDPGIASYSTCGKDRLNSTEYAIYGKLKTKIADVAAGRESATQWTIQTSDLEGADLTWTYSELGLATGATGDEIKAAVGQVFSKEVPLSPLMGALLADCPYDLYWFDKTAGMGMNYGMTYSPGRSVSITYIRVGMFVSADYSSNGASGALTTNMSKTSATTMAVNNARSIVSKHQGENSSTKLTSYKDEICKLVTYNEKAASNVSVAYGDPWQLVYVFDGDTSTNVVCEGYSKAFQYLCDLTTWNDDTTCYSVWGMMSGGTGAGNHMWNVVAQDGTNYLVDVTNSDSGTIGQNGSLFMVTSASSNCAQSNASGYTFKAGSNYSTSIAYQYDPEMNTLYTNEVLELVSKNSLSKAAIASIKDYIYTGSAIKPAVTVTFDGTTLVNGTDYTVEYENNTSAGTAKVTVSGKGDYVGTKTVDFKIAPKPLTESMMSSSIPSQTYTGSTLIPAVSVKDGSKTLTRDTDYTVAYKNNKNAGKASLTIKAVDKGNYTGEITKTFTITPKSLSSKSVSSKLSYTSATYNGKSLRPTVTVKDGKTTLKKDTDYTVTYRSNKQSGKATVTIQGKGNYSGKITKTFNIKPAKVTDVKTSSSKKGKVTVKWSNKQGKAANVTGYKIVVKSGSKTIKTQYVSGKSAKSKTITLASKYKGKKVKTYVYAYKTIDKKKVCSSASSASTVKVKR